MHLTPKELQLIAWFKQVMEFVVSMSILPESTPKPQHPFEVYKEYLYIKNVAAILQPKIYI